MANIPGSLDTSVVAPALYFFTSIGNLFLAILVAFRSRATKGSLPLALLCLSMFVWHVGEGLWLAASAVHWKYLRLVGSSMAPAFAFHFVLYFAGREKDFGRHTWLLYGLTALFALLTAGALALDVLRALVDHWVWNVVYILVLLPFLGLAFLILLRRMREVETRAEKNALNFISLGLAIGVVSGLVDLTVALGSPIPPIGHLGGLACTIILAVAIFRHRFLETDLPFQRIIVIFLVAVVAVALNFLLYARSGGERGDLFLVGTAAVIVLVLAVYRLVLVGWQERQEHRKRLELMGTMTAGVAHEIRNPLASIKGAAQFVQKELETRAVDGDAREYLKLVIDETDRLNQVVENFLDFARPLQPKLRPVEVQPLIEEMVTMARAAGGREIETSLNGAPPVSADPDLLRVAFGNILRNAGEAAARRIAVRVRRVPPHVSIEIEDDGPGIPPDQIDRVFQPFFTTKARGTGLGLATARRIVESHGGTIGVTNLQPNGARFTITLPVG